ncbi:MAG: carboxypeptidase regulatory-like domain-containing protein [Campylobacterota bacterium]|nr:carboxypeptidase regulatory-like domain-containing protein [Campylobacterota bacterium]
MNSSIRMIIVALLSTFLMFQGCSSGGGGSSSGGEPQTPIGNEEPTDITTIKQGSFSIDFEDENIEVFDYKLSIMRGSDELTDTLLEYVTHEKQSDGSIVISLKEVEKNGVSEGGLTSLALGDVITLEADGYTPQQFVVDEGMLEKSETEIALKAVESRQTFNLADMTSGTEAVTPRSARGATTRVTEEGVVFETLGSGISLTMPKMTYERLVRKISRLPRSGPNTEVYIDMTSIDPRTEHSATIGNFSFDSTSEPSDDRSTNAVNEDETALESVVMADMKMTTSAGDEIHCFGGEYDPATNSCSSDAKATLKMQIPQSQFNQYAQKYNEGDRVVPLYAYNKLQGTWQRQLGSDGKGLDSELVLTDNDSNQKANEGDVLTLVGKVGHFSWWNGDYPLEKTCLDVTVDLTNAPNASSYVQVKGVDYTGRIFKKYLSSETTEVTNISAKQNSIVSIELIMKDGSVGDSITYATSVAEGGVCEVVEETLVAPLMNSLTLDVLVKDTQGNFLEGAYVRSKGQYKYTDANGSATVSYAYAKDANLSETISVSYYSDGFSVEGEKTVTQDTASPVVFELDIEKKTFSGSVVEVINGIETPASEAYVEIYNYSPYYSKSVTTDENGSFTMELPKSFVEEDSDAIISIRKYKEEYAFYPRYSDDVDLSTIDLGEFQLAFDTHLLSGQVSDTEGEPIANSYVYARDGFYKNTRSDENGNYEFTIFGESGKEGTLQAGTYEGRYLYSEKENFFTEANGSSAHNLTIDLRKATIKGRVLTSNGIALENMRVYWSRDYYRYVLTDVNGSFTLETYNGGDGFVRVYDSSSYSYLDFDANSDVRDVALDGVEVGKVYDLENMLAEEKNFAPIISEVSIDPDSPLVDVAFTISVDAYDPDGDTITYGVEEYYDRGTVELDGSVATVTMDSVGYYYFNITATDVNGNTSRKKVSVYVKNHVRPVIDSVSYVYPNEKRYFDKSEVLDIKVEAHSDEGNALSYTYTLESLSSDVEDGAVDVNASDNSQASIATTVINGKYRLVVTVSDVYNETTTRRYITIDSSVAPEIATFIMNGVEQTSLTVKEGVDVNLNVSLKDARNVTELTWYWYVNGKTYETQSIDTVRFTQEGSYYGYVTVRDASNRSDSQRFYVNVQEDAKPVIDFVSVTPSVISKIDEGYVNANGDTVEEIVLSVEAHDDDSASLTYSFAPLGESKVGVSENNATYTLKGLAVGKHAIKVTVSDVTNSVENFVNIEILKDAPPVITEFRVPLRTKVSQTLDLVANATEPNGQIPTYSWSATSGSITDADRKNAKLTVSNIVEDINVTLTVSDGVNEVSRTRKVEVLENSAPIISYFNLRTTAVALDNQEIELKSIFGDVDGTIEVARYIVEDSNGTLLAEQNITRSGIQSTMKLSLGSGTYLVYLEVSDESGSTVRSSKEEFVVAQGNAAPIITSLSATSSALLEGEETELNVVASDVDGDAISYSWSSEGGVVVQDTASQDKATFSALSADEYKVTVIATDTSGAKAIKVITITVSSATLSISSDATSYILGSDVTLVASMSSEHAVTSSTTWSVVEKPAASTLSIATSGVTVTVTPDAVGTYKLKADTTINGVAFSAEKSFSVQEESGDEADLEGVVTADNGDILSGAQVRLYNKTDATLYDVTATTDSSGTYSFSEVPAGSYYLVVYAGNGYVSHTQVVEIVK